MLDVVGDNRGNAGRGHAPRVRISKKRAGRMRWVYRIENPYARFVGPDLQALVDEIGQRTHDRLLLPRARLHARGGSRGRRYKGWRLSRAPLDEWDPDAELETAATSEADLTVILPASAASTGDNSSLDSDGDSSATTASTTM